MLTFNILYGISMSSMVKDILNDSGCVSQTCSLRSYRIEGLRVLAKLIAHDLLAKRRDNTTMTNDRKVGDPHVLEDCR